MSCPLYNVFSSFFFYRSNHLSTPFSPVPAKFWQCLYLHSICTCPQSFASYAKSLGFFANFLVLHSFLIFLSKGEIAKLVPLNSTSLSFIKSAHLCIQCLPNLRGVQLLYLCILHSATNIIRSVCILVLHSLLVAWFLIKNQFFWPLCRCSVSKSFQLKQFLSLAQDSKKEKTLGCCLIAMTPIRQPHLKILAFLLILVEIHSVCSYPTPMNCTDTTRLCTSFLAFQRQQNQTLAVIQSMFDVLSTDVTVEGNGRDYVFIKKNCSCASSIEKYVTNTTYTVKSNEGFVYDLVINAYDGLAFFPNTTRKAKNGAVISLRLFCGCSSGLWNYLMSYVMKDGDTIASLSSRFGLSMDDIEKVNGITDPDNVTVGSLFYIPLNSVPGEPYPLQNHISPVTAPASSPATTADSLPVNQVDHKTHVPYVWIVGGLGVALALILFGTAACCCLRSSICGSEGRRSHTKEANGENSHKFHILRNSSFCCGSGRYICGKSSDCKQTNDEPSQQHQITIPKALGTDLIDMDKPIVFTYEENFNATDGFSDSNLLGHGTYGSVYYGLLHDQEVAIKRMTATKTKEFLSEMKVLCKVHHSNLVELIGYAASDDELFVIYEYAQKGSLRSHLHDPQSNGHSSLSWIMRVQIALDAARGLEYIHEHTKTHYVHRDIKTSNILLDASFRAKISDFGLAKLVGNTKDGDITATKVVGTYGYLAPEYLSEGLATTKSDVYAFGVVLFEIISGKEAVIRTEGTATKNPERRSLASIMLAALRNLPDSMNISSMKDNIDPNMMDLYPHDCLYKIAVLAKQCVDDDPILRPDMKQVVISLSQILLSSVEWEATLAGNSQVFSGLVQGR